MSLLDFETIFLWIIKYCDLLGVRTVEMLWFGGEPLLIGKDSIYAALQIQKNLFETTGIRIVNRMQSNLTLISDWVCDLLRRFFDSSISGSVEPYGSCRILANGVPSLKIVENNIRLLKKEKVKVGLVCTLTRHDLVAPTEFYNWFKQRSDAFRVNRAHPPHSNDKTNYLSVKEYDAYVQKLFHLYTQDPSPIAKLVNFTAIARSILLKQPLGCADIHKPWLRFEMTGKGNIYSYCRKSTTLMGNCYSSTPEEVLMQFKERKRFIQESETCSACRWKMKNVCVGGCPEENLDCEHSECGYRTEYTRAMYEYVSSYLDRLEISSMEDCVRKIPEIS